MQLALRTFAAGLVKLSNSKFLTRELKENPEFYKAFPHLAPEMYQEETHKFIEKTSKEPFFQSLQNQHANYLRTNNAEQMLTENEKNFVQAAQAHVEGPHKYLTEQQKQKVHQEVEKRMQELEETGLSRMELLYDNMEGKGCQLKDDPFFQLVKGSRTVREMIVPPGAEFTADQVIE